MRQRRWIIGGCLLALPGAGAFLYRFDLIPLPEVEHGDYPIEQEL
jgi:hypothetical protein